MYIVFFLNNSLKTRSNTRIHLLIAPFRGEKGTKHTRNIDYNLLAKCLMVALFYNMTEYLLHCEFRR